MYKKNFIFCMALILFGVGQLLIASCCEDNAMSRRCCIFGVEDGDECACCMEMYCPIKSDSCLSKSLGCTACYCLMPTCIALCCYTQDSPSNSVPFNEKENADNSMHPYVPLHDGENTDIFANPENNSSESKSFQLQRNNKIAGLLAAQQNKSGTVRGLLNQADQDSVTL